MNAHSGHGTAASTYVEQEILSEAPLARVARLYEMARLEVARSRAALVGGDKAAKGIAVSRAIRIVSLLQSCLNIEEGGDVARNLDRLYGYMLHRLSRAHAEDDAQGFDEVGRHLSELGGAWREVAGRSKETVAPRLRPAAEATIPG